MQKALGALSALFLSVSVLAQDFIDLESERARPSTSPLVSEAQPDGENVVRPIAVPQGSVSYGLNGQIATTKPSVLVQDNATNAASDPGSLFVQVQRLAEEVRRLNGVVEEQAYQIKTLQQQSLERYMDIDRRLAGGAVSTTAPAQSKAVVQEAASAPVTASDSATPPADAKEEPAYLAARQLVYDRKFDDAVASFNEFLLDYPNGAYAPNAHYWLGELYLVLEQPNLELSRQAFQLLLDLYPQHNKVPDASFKLATVYFAKGNVERAKTMLEAVIATYPKQPVAELAKKFLADKY
ncbi:MAG: tol-pal system protein YbgF, partial [Aequoribacter sp.]|uniref:tol-pal system protein YbgF n=1 Tax=Aequoribacter sp. TaxID=2847771 RepID=UPI003C5A41A8